MDKRDRYCVEVCKAKCCYLHTPWREEPVKCPRLAEDGSCTVYNRRYGELLEEPLVVVGRWVSKVRRDIDGVPVEYPFFCGRVKDIIANGTMPKEVEAQCCYAHPELLDMEDK